MGDASMLNRFKDRLVRIRVLQVFADNAHDAGFAASNSARQFDKIDAAKITALLDRKLIVRTSRTRPTRSGRPASILIAAGQSDELFSL